MAALTSSTWLYVASITCYSCLSLLYVKAYVVCVCGHAHPVICILHEMHQIRLNRNTDANCHCYSVLIANSIDLIPCKSK
ncbi:hypothetical protein XELAEV_18027353mg [Xenopus laevis]|uniref:Uncharacterized protein n=1 Tax=Xenopus laevis TaxID=8355 RepID=A0A974CW71_XENLA|nr:hypothetical protein XELAEV_18027353mg [Xenopus laevis]